MSKPRKRVVHARAGNHLLHEPGKVRMLLYAGIYPDTFLGHADGYDHALERALFAENTRLTDEE